MACEDLEEQLASLQRQRDDVVAKLNNLGAGGNPGNRFQLLLELRQINIQISAAKVGLDACLKSVTGTPAAPQHILELRHINPEFHPTDPDWAAKLAGGELLAATRVARQIKGEKSPDIISARRVVMRWPVRARAENKFLCTFRGRAAGCSIDWCCVAARA